MLKQTILLEEKTKSFYTNFIFRKERGTFRLIYKR